MSENKKSIPTITWNEALEQVHQHPDGFIIMSANRSDIYCVVHDEEERDKWLNDQGLTLDQVSIDDMEIDEEASFDQCLEVLEP